MPPVFAMEHLLGLFMTEGHEHLAEPVCQVAGNLKSLLVSAEVIRIAKAGE